MSEASEKLSQLYPYLKQGSRQAHPTRTTLLESLQRKSRDSANVQARFFETQAEVLLEMAQAIANVYQSQGRLLCMGNGGSSCDAAHVAVEFNHPVTTGRSALPAINLAADMPMMTAIGNDVGFDEIFQRQVISQGRKGDALLGISTSGGAANLLLAFQAAKQAGLTTMALLGGDGGAIGRSGVVDHCLVVESDSIHRIQETHVIAYHQLWDLVHSFLGAAQ